MRVQRVVLEHHRDVAILGRHIVDQLVADIDLARSRPSSPAIIRNVVVLPQPDGPTSTINSRSAISRSIPCTAGVLSNILTTLRSATCAIFTSFFDRLLPPCGAARGLV